MAQNTHFQVYSQTTDKTAEKALLWFEQLRTFFLQDDLFSRAFSADAQAPLRIVGLRSEKEYVAYRNRPLADAYYAADGKQEFIVMASLQPAQFSIAAHEYAHYVVHAGKLKLPIFLQEGLAEFFSTLQVKGDRYLVGGDLPARTHTLHTHKWLPLADLLSIADERAVSNSREGASLFYAESWALVDMLMASPQYSARFRQLLSELNAGSNCTQALRRIYGRPLEQLTKDLESWIGLTRPPHTFGTQANAADSFRLSTLSDSEARALEAEISVVSGHLEQAKLRYQELAREHPDNPDFAAALGSLAQRQGNITEALKFWRQAIDNNLTDAELCFRFALTAEEAGLGAPDIRAGLERAVFLSPGFDDARYKLALLQFQAGEHRSAVTNLRAMRLPSEARRYAYWTAMASALLELNEHEEAMAAAREAEKAARSEDERISARRMAIIASTDLAVQFATDADGHSQMVTTRMLHGSKDWNPFVEPSDQMRYANGRISEVVCTNGKLSGFLLRTANGTLSLEVPDPTHVLMRNGPEAFFCGPLQAKPVKVDFAVVTSIGKSVNLLRGMTFQP